MIAETLSGCGLSTPDFLIEAEFDTRSWQSDWTELSSNQRLPAIYSDRGAALVGLGSRERLRLFLASGLFSTANLDETSEVNVSREANA